jgi:hypothetical protein
MTDSPTTGKKSNLTIQSLPPLISDTELQGEVQNLCDKALVAAEFAREHRNKRIAHQDHDYLSNHSSDPLRGINRKLIEEMLAALRAVLNRLDLHFRDNTVIYEDFVGESGARLLVYKLRKMEQLQGAATSAP